MLFCFFKALALSKVQLSTTGQKVLITFQRFLKNVIKFSTRQNQVPADSFFETYRGFKATHNQKQATSERIILEQFIDADVYLEPWGL